MNGKLIELLDRKPSNITGIAGSVNLKEAVEVLHDMFIIERLMANGYHVTNTSREINVCRESIRNVCRKYGIDNKLLKKPYNKSAPAYQREILLSDDRLKDMYITTDRDLCPLDWKTIVSAEKCNPCPFRRAEKCNVVYEGL